MFSGSDDHAVKCWDLERNEVVREFFGHKSAVHTLALHPSLDVVVSGGRDTTVRVWDIRSRAAVHTLVGHTNSVMSVVTQESDPQVISGGSDGFIFQWDLAAGKAQRRLTQHKKPVRGLALNSAKNMLVSCGADDIRLWDLPSGDYKGAASTQVAKKGVVAEATEEIAYRWSCCAMSPRNVLAVGCQDRQLALYDWKQPQPVTGRLELSQKAPCFYAPYQLTKTKNIPGTLDGEGGINAVVFDHSGTRMITAESDKSVKIWQMRD
ncbi:pleiotropic regulator 1 [Strigomonas culicis]|uniref:Pleiotropic regulator 1 n=1 Tax=Strigomonas culicis TaxID=28005 RepID=S9TRY6_9TRYP|nr:pleiotropic regulator 1 [Strigomonas culicis]EPY36293.1 pleiotropic regulator 1 [Strigomonas culicis]|eukprot:EPY21112.1 pleiotropic regulator 1 [Strigomonas culicis]